MLSVSFENNTLYLKLEGQVSVKDFERLITLGVEKVPHEEILYALTDISRAEFDLSFQDMDAINKLNLESIEKFKKVYEAIVCYSIEELQKMIYFQLVAPSESYHPFIFSDIERAKIWLNNQK